MSSESLAVEGDEKTGGEKQRHLMEKVVDMTSILETGPQKTFGLFGK
jgi:hypothetical protein